MEGTPFGRYQLIELLGRGGMGEVWRAHDTAIDRVVALKMLLPHYAEDAEYEKRFRREARLAARLDDPHVVPIHDVGEIDGRLYVTMRLINGVDLHTLLQSGPMDLNRAVHIIEQIASALHTAHQAGLVHRDVKPSNILVGRDDFAYLIDFGIARATDETMLTSATSTLGTWAYMAPERFSSADIGPSSDIYALTCVLYQCITGRQPFPGTTLEQVAIGHMVNPPPKPSDVRAGLPPGLDTVVAIGLAKQPTDRYRTTVDMAAAARQALSGLTTAAGTIAPVPPPPAPPQPTQHGFAGAQVAPTQMGPQYPHAPTLPPPPPQAPKRRRRGALIGALAGVALLVVAGGVFAVVRNTGSEAATNPTETATAAPIPAPSDQGPFTGTYTANFSKPTLIDGSPIEGGKPAKATWAVRSLCRRSGCVATASRRNGDGPEVNKLVFDKIGDQWMAVGLGTENCKGSRVELWSVFTLKQEADGTFAGDYSGTTENGCSGVGTVTFTRTGDVDVDSLPDPADLPPRKISPAEALHGHYTDTRIFPNGLPKTEEDVTVTTHCLRTGDRCMSYFYGPAGVRPLVFANGKWSWTNKYSDKCPGGDPLQATETAEFPLPQPPQNPITRLTGRGHTEGTGSCALITDFDETFTRIGNA